MKLSKRTKIAIITFVVLGATGIGVLKIKEFIDKKKKKKSSDANNKMMKVIFEIPDDLKPKK